MINGVLIGALSVVAFVAGVVDSVAGGGGLLMVPALLLAGFPPQIALGTNKFASTLGTSVAIANFVYRKKIVLRVILLGLGFTLVGGYVGGKLVLALDGAMVAKVIVALLPVGALAIVLPKSKKEGVPIQGLFFWIGVPVFCLGMGLYDGFFGPGAGTFLSLGFYLLFRLDLVRATGSAKVFNGISNLGALLAFLAAGKVVFLLGAPMAMAAMGGNFLGSHLAIKQGDILIKRCMLAVLALLLITLVVKYC